MGEKFRQFLRKPTNFCEICEEEKNTALLVVSETESLELCSEHFAKALVLLEKDSK